MCVCVYGGGYPWLAGGTECSTKGGGLFSEKLGFECIINQDLRIVVLRKGIIINLDFWVLGSFGIVATIQPSAAKLLPEFLDFNFPPIPL